MEGTLLEIFIFYNDISSLYVYIEMYFRWIVLCRQRITLKVNAQIDRAQYIFKTKTATLEIWNTIQTVSHMEYHMWKEIHSTKDIQVIHNA